MQSTDAGNMVVSQAGEVGSGETAQGVGATWSFVQIDLEGPGWTPETHSLLKTRCTAVPLLGSQALPFTPEPRRPSRQAAVASGVCLPAAASSWALQGGLQGHRATFLP